MGSATVLNQLFRNLCHHTMWKYAILWKFQHENHMLLTCKDSYAIDTKSGTAMEHAPYKEFIRNHPGVSSFGCDSNDQSGSIPDSSIVVAVSNMTRFSYLPGEGIVGKVASMEKHRWICVGEMNSELILECPEELGLHVAAGIKTILLLPVLPLGLVQLGSLDKVSEDLIMVAQLKDLFCAYQYTLDSYSIFELKMEQTDSYMSLIRPPLEKYSTCFEINTKLTDPIQSQPLTKPDLATLSFDQAMLNEHLPIDSVSLPHPMVQSYDLLTKDGLHQAHGLGTDLLDEIRWNAMCSELFRDHSEEQLMLNTAIFTGRTMESDQSTPLHEKEVKPIPVVSHRLTSKGPNMFNACMKDLLHNCNDLCDFSKGHLKFAAEFDAVIDSTTDCRYLDFSVEAAGLHKVMEHNCLMDNGSAWMDNQPIDDEGSKLITTFTAELPEAIGYSVEPCVFMNENITEYLAQIAMEELPCVSDDKELESCECVKSGCSSSGRCTDSCLTQCKTEDVSNSEDSGLESQKMSSLVSDSEGFTSYLTSSPSRRFVHMSVENEDHQASVCDIWRGCLKEPHNSTMQVKNRGESHKPRPRDRQLIQDRIRELRDLIPNASKCSIDTLLERTVKHMMFLQSVPFHADKLSQSKRPKAGVKDLNSQGSQMHQNKASWSCEAETKSMQFPVVVENLDQPDQMLVEMQCRNYVLFLEIAQAIKRLGLTILKGILESRLEELWAHFIVEIPKGFHRMDIVWPLMQLLQLKF